jgi:hypothetical protein
MDELDFLPVIELRSLERLHFIHDIYDDGRFMSFYFSEPESHLPRLKRLPPPHLSICAFSQFQPYVIPDFFDWSIKDRLMYVSTPLTFWGFDGLEWVAFRQIKAGKAVTSQNLSALCEQDPDFLEQARTVVVAAVCARVPLISVAAKLRATVRVLEARLDLDHGFYMPGSKQRNIFRAILRLSDDLHPTSCRLDNTSKSSVRTFGGTPLLIFLGSISARQYWHSFDLKRRATKLSQIRHALVAWLEDLAAENVDLLEYGKRERYLLHTRKKLRRRKFEFHFFAEDYELNGGPTFRTVTATLNNIIIHRDPEKWDLVWDFWPERFCKPFWQLIEDPPCPVPGAWPESYQSDCFKSDSEADLSDEDEDANFSGNDQDEFSNDHGNDEGSADDDGNDGN